MILCLDVAVEQERPEPGLAGRLGGRHAPEQVTERLRGTIPMLALRPRFALQAKLEQILR